MQTDNVRNICLKTNWGTEEVPVSNEVKIILIWSDFAVVLQFHIIHNLNVYAKIKENHLMCDYQRLQ